MKRAAKRVSGFIVLAVLGFWIPSCGSKSPSGPSPGPSATPTPAPQPTPTPTPGPTPDPQAGLAAGPVTRLDLKIRSQAPDEDRSAVEDRVQLEDGAWLVRFNYYVVLDLTPFNVRNEKCRSPLFPRVSVEDPGRILELIGGSHEFLYKFKTTNRAGRVKITAEVENPPEVGGLRTIHSNELEIDVRR